VNNSQCRTLCERHTSSPKLISPICTSNSRRASLAVTCVAATSFEWGGDELQAVRRQHDVCHPGHWHWHWHWRRLSAAYLTATMIVAVVCYCTISQRCFLLSSGGTATLRLWMSGHFNYLAHHVLHGTFLDMNPENMWDHSRRGRRTP
jgi:hypothetical protein